MYFVDVWWQCLADQRHQTDHIDRMLKQKMQHDALIVNVISHLLSAAYKLTAALYIVNFAIAVFIFKPNLHNATPKEILRGTLNVEEKIEQNGGHQCLSESDKGPSIKYVTLEGEGVRKGVTVCDKGKGDQEHVTSHL